VAYVEAVAWGPNRLDVFGIDTSDGVAHGVLHRAWLGDHWHPSTGWQKLGGDTRWDVAVASWGPDRLDIFAYGGTPDGGSTDLIYKAWEGTHWSPSAGWIPFSPQSSTHGVRVASWAANRLHVFTFDDSSAMLCKAWNGSNWTQGWRHLGGEFESSPSVASWGPNRLDIFGLGKSSAMFHKAWMGTDWHPPNPDWQNLGGKFSRCQPAVVSWGPDRLDIFGIGEHHGMYHKAWDGSQWYPSQTGWQGLGGTFYTYLTLGGVDVDA
jgi:hypothetical protein